MADVNKTILISYDLETGKLVDANGKAITSVKKLIEELKGATEAQQKMGDVVGKNSEIVLGSISHLKKQLAATKQQRENTEIGSEAFLRQTQTIRELEARIRNSTKLTIENTNAQQNASQATESLSKLQENQSRAAGLAGAATFELGRTISDLPFGLVAISNNISQLGTLMTALVANAGSVKEALKALRTQIMGPGGLLVAFQIVTAAVTFFAQRAGKANKEINSLAEATGRSAVSLKLAKEALQDENTSLKEKEEIIKSLNKEYDTFNLSLDASGRLSEENVAKIDKEIEALTRLARARAFQSLLEDAFAEQAKLIAKFTEETGKPITTLKNLLLGVGNEFVGSQVRFSQFINSLQDISKRIDFIKTSVAEEGLIDLMIGGDKRSAEESEILIDGTIKAIEKQISALEKQRDSTATTTAQVKAFNDQIKALKASLEELQTAKSRLSVEVELVIDKQGKISFEDLINPPDTASQKWAREQVKKIADAASDELQKRVESQGERNFFVDTFGVSQETINNTLDQIQQGLDATFGLITAQMDKELALEQNKTTALNDQLRARLRNEQLTAEQRDKIQQQISNNEAELVKKQNEIEKKKFQLNKAQGIANAVVNTATAVTKVLPNIPLAGFIGALGAAQVAAIAAQTFTPKPMPAPNLTALGSAGETGQSGPAFNVVGGSQFNQLANAIEAALSRTPIKSYVVSSDVTTAQELERKIVEGASI